MKNVYFINEDDTMIYEANIADVQESVNGRQGYITYNVELVCGKEYPTDDSLSMKWCSPDYFVEDVQGFNIIQYFEEQPMLEAFEDEGLYPYGADLPSKIYEWKED